jgi:hypothetical protein
MRKEGSKYTSRPPFYIRYVSERDVSKMSPIKWRERYIYDWLSVNNNSPGLAADVSTGFRQDVTHHCMSNCHGALLGEWLTPVGLWLALNISR